ncbi:MAG: amino acid ABC transporter substrate-binding protein [Chlamydiae bacterium]|nr:amino acid ABC transporter substrate-binding protein [Chlamydiota bacterium]
MAKVFGVFLLLTLFLCGCSSKKETYVIGIDKSFYGLEAQGQQKHLYGFIEELLSEIASEMKVEFNLTFANWDSIMFDLEKGKYQAVFSSMVPHNFTESRYDFSKNFFPTGPVLIIPLSDKNIALEKIKNKHAGVITGSNSILILQKYPDITPQSFDSIPALLDGVVMGDVDLALLDITLAYPYIKDIYSESLKIGSSPLNDEGLRLISMKDQQKKLMTVFDKGLKALEKNKKLKAIEEKWGFFPKS